MTEVREPRILIYDIETSLQLVGVFQLGDNNWIQPSNIVQERHMLSACWMWLDEEKVHSVSLLDDPKRYEKDPHDDYHVVKTIRDVIAEADVIVAHYGDSFDNKYVLTRILAHDLDPIPPVQSIDTKKIAKSRFYFNSNSLEYLAKYLKCKNHKLVHTASGLWIKILKGGNEAKDALKKMVAYNKGDVLALRDVFLKLRPYIPNYVNRELFGGTGCPRCGGKKVQSRGTYYAQTRTYRRWQCQSEGCRGWFKTLIADKGSTTKHRVL